MPKKSAPVSTRKTCQVQFSIVGPGYGLTGGPGQLFDLSAPIPGAPNGLTVADVTRPDWFTDEPQPAAPVETDHVAEHLS